MSMLWFSDVVVVRLHLAGILEQLNPSDHGLVRPETSYILFNIRLEASASLVQVSHDVHSEDRKHYIREAEVKSFINPHVHLASEADVLSQVPDPNRSRWHLNRPTTTKDSLCT